MSRPRWFADISGALGWDNQLWRLGDDLAVRMPWATDDADELLLKEHSLIPGLALRLPLPIPVPTRLGQPSDLFPRTWIITTWLLGEPADRVRPTKGVAAADALAGFLSALHGPAPSTAPVGRHGRGGSLSASAASPLPPNAAVVWINEPLLLRTRSPIVTGGLANAQHQTGSRSRRR